MSDVQAEKILVIPTSRFHEIGYFQGFCRDVDRYVRKLFEGPHLSFRTRGEMEDDPSFKQLIPYVILRHLDDEGTPRVFQYTRGKGLGEGRLHRRTVVHREPSNRPEVVSEFAREVSQFLRDGDIDPEAFLRELARVNPAIGRRLAAAGSRRRVESRRPSASAPRVRRHSRQ